MNNQNPIISTTTVAIKIVGIGSAGCNAVQRIYSGGKARDCASFLIIHTDLQSLEHNAVPEILHISEVQGFWSNPAEAAEAQADAIRKALSDGTQMVIIIAGMGGSTGTGVAPIVARIAGELGIVAVGLVTIPFTFEGLNRLRAASDGMEKMRQLAAVFTVNNNRLVETYPDLNFSNAMSTSDEVLAATVETLMGICTALSFISLDFDDIKRALCHPGEAVLMSGTAQGERRIARAIEAALFPSAMPDDVAGAKSVILQLCYAEENPVQIKELSAIEDFVKKLHPDVSVMWCASVDPSLGKDVKIVILATGLEHDVLDDGQTQE